MSQYSLLNSNPYLAPQQPAFVPDLTGPLELVSRSDALAVTLEEAKIQCRQEEDDDVNIRGLINAAQEYVECDQSYTLLSTTFDLPVRGWWGNDTGLSLPRPPLLSVSSIRYYDAAGNVQTLDSSWYEVRKPWKQPAVILRAPLKTWPTLQCDRKYPIAIRFVAGFPDAASVPQLIKQAMLLLIEYWYDERSAVSEPLAGADRLLNLAGWGQYR